MLKMFIEKGFNPGEQEVKGMIKDARSALLKMKPDYTVEFIWLMAEYKAGVRDHIEELIRTPSIKGILFQHQARIRELIDSF